MSLSDTLTILALRSLIVRNYYVAPKLVNIFLSLKIERKKNQSRTIGKIREIQKIGEIQKNREIQKHYICDADKAFGGKRLDG